LGICDTKHVGENARLGFVVERTLASNGTFEYPRPALRAQVLKLDDPGALACKRSRTPEPPSSTTEASRSAWSSSETTNGASSSHAT
jgi:hypothetical protein